MNLKEAAHHLGVHYQTAYKWVRAGELVAVRVGGRYEVSKAAIERFEATRRALAASEDFPELRVDPATAPLDPEDLVEELEALIVDPFVALPSVVAFVARRAAAVLGDMCLVASCEENGGVRFQSVDHQKAEQAAVLAGALHLTDNRPAPIGGIAAAAFLEQRVIRMPHLPQDWLRRSVRPELLQHLARGPVHSVLALPVIAEGASVGVVMFTRDAPNHPYTEMDAAYAQRLVDRVALLFRSAEELEVAWQVRGELVKRLTRHLRSGASAESVSSALLDDLLRDTPGSADLPVVIFDHTGRVLATNDRALRLSGYSSADVEGRMVESFTHPADVELERTHFGRLVSGELDYMDIVVRRVLADESEPAFVSHRGAIRDLDATLRFVVSVSRPVRTAPDTVDHVVAYSGGIGN